MNSQILIPYLKKHLPHTVYGLILLYIASIAFGILPPNPIQFYTQNTPIKQLLTVTQTSPTYWVGKASNGYHWLVRSKTPQNPGDQLEITGHIQPVKGPRFPGDHNRKEWLKQNQIVGVILPKKTTQLASGPWYHPKRLATETHHRITLLFENLLPIQQAHLLTSFVYGNQALTLDPEVSTHFQRSGLTHLLVASGSQVSMIIGGFLVILKRMTRSKIIQLVWIILASLALYLITGGGASITRAIIMANIAFLIALTSRKAHPLQVIILTLGLMLGWNPYLIGNPGFQLSFAATIALCLGVPTIEKWFPDPWPTPIKTYLALTLAPFLFTAPIIAFHFHTLSLTSIPANFLVLAGIEWIVWTGFITSIIGNVWQPLAIIPAHFCWALLNYTDWVATTLSHHPWAQIITPTLTAFESTLIFLGILLLLWPCFKGSKWIGIALVLTSLTLSFSCQFLPTSQLTITVLDVEQGDAILIETPHHHAWLIDTGNKLYHSPGSTGPKTYAETVILPTLHYKGISHLKGIIVTHLDADHSGGLSTLLSNVKVDAVYHNGSPQLANQAEAAHVPQFALCAGQTLAFDTNLSFKILNPQHANLGLSENNRCVVGLLTYNQFSMLFTGDLEEEGESLLRYYYPNFLKATVLKTGHHGSKTSTTEAFLTQVQPQIAAISVGQHNTFGHPNHQVLQRLNHHNILIHRTDTQGSIEYQSNGTQLAVKFYN